MELAISLQLYQASTALLFGFAAGVFYDVLRTLRRRLKRSGWAVFLDILYWLTLSIALFAQTMTTGQGVVRIFMLVINFGGGVVYFIILSAKTRRILDRIADLLVWIWMFATKPMRIIWSKSRNWIRRHKKGFQNQVKHYIIKVNFHRQIKKQTKIDGSGGEINAQKEEGQYLRKASRSRSRRLRIGHTDGSPQPDRKRASGKSRDGTKRNRAGANQ